MSDVRTTLRLFDEFLWVLRREGIAVSPADAIDAMRAIRLAGLADGGALRMALEAILLHSHAERPAFEGAWSQVFERSAPQSNLRAFLIHQGATELEVREIEALLARAHESFTYLLQTPGGGAELAHSLSTGPAGDLQRAHQDPAREGAASHAIAARVGVSEAKQLARRWRGELSETFGHERAEWLVRALERAADLAMPEIRRVLRAAREAREARARAGGAMRTGLDALSEAEAQEVQRALARFVARLQGRWRVRSKQARKGRIHVGASLRAAWRTGGAPMVLVRKARVRRRPSLVLLCDVSESVRAHTRFTLEFVRATLELFSDARAFVFVRDVQEVSEGLRAHGSSSGVEQVLFAGLPSTDNSNYGVAFTRFAERHGDALHRDTTLVILGDGRSNHSDPHASVLGGLRARVKALHWLCPESEERWGQGDSAIPDYRPHCTRVWEARTAEDILTAARALAG